MKNILIILFFLVETITVYSQDIIDTYRSAADQGIHRSFDSSLLDFIRCTEVRYNSESNLETWVFDYEDIKFQKVNAQSIFFTYSFFSTPIRDTFSFVVSVTKKPNSPMVVSGFESVPVCIKKNEGCSFITRDSALQIAEKDSILYSENLSSIFQKQYNRDEYYWIIIGRPKEVYSTSRRSSVARVSPRSRKYIHASTGKLISWQEYQKSN